MLQVDSWALLITAISALFGVLVAAAQAFMFFILKDIKQGQEVLTKNLHAHIIDHAHGAFGIHTPDLYKSHKIP